MSSNIWFLIAAVLAFGLHKLWRIGSRASNLPPGPPTVPLLGNAHLFPNKFAQYRLTEWSRQFGDIFSLTIGPGVIIVVSSMAAVKDVLDKQASITSDRPQTTIGDTVTGGNHIAQQHLNDPKWTRMRRAAQAVMTTQRCLEHLPVQRAEAIQLLYDVLKDPKQFNKHAQRYTFSFITSVVYGVRFPRFQSQAVKDFYHVTGLWSRIMEPGRHPPIDLIPILKKVPERWASWKTEAKTVRTLQRALYFGLLDRCRDRLQKGESVGCFMENIIQNQERQQMNREMVGYLGGVLLEGAADTTSSYIRSLHLALTTHPEAQRKAHEEMDRVVGRDRLPTLDDLENLPYVLAIIREVQRWRPAAPLGLPHAALGDAHYRGYTIPSGSTIFVNVWALTRDENVYDRPNDFWPERFILSEFGTKKGVDVSDFRHTLVYGSGKRICPGIHLAKNSVENNTMTLIWAFKFSKAIDPGTKKPIEIDTSDYTEGLFTAPNPFPCEITPRSAHHADLIEQAIRDASSIYTRFEMELDPEDAKYVAMMRGDLNKI